LASRGAALRAGLAQAGAWVGPRPHWLASPVWGWMGSDGVVLLVGVAVLALAWARLAVGDASLLVFQDASEQIYAWWQYSVSELQSGHFPLWDPYTFGGRTHVGEGQEGVFYPPFLFVAFVAGPWAGTIAAIDVFAFAHAALALAGAHLLARVVGLRGLGALGCGLVYSLGSFFTLRAVAQLNIFDATAWVPFVIAGPFLVARTRKVRWALLSGGALALSVLAGHAQPALHASMVLGLAVVFLCFVRIWPTVSVLEPRQALLAVFLTAASAACLSAVQLLPMLEYQPLALRWVGAEEPIGASARIPFDIIATNPSLDVRLLPAAFFNSRIQIPDAGVYVGLAALVCAVLGVCLHTNPTRFLWLVLLGLGVILAMGSATPLLQLISVLPLVDKIREPVRYLLLAHLSLAVLAGLGVDYLARRRALWWRGTAVGLIAVAAVELGVAWSSGMPMRTGGGASLEVQHFYNSVEANGVAEFLATQPGIFRIDLTDSALPRNYGELLRVPTVNGYRATSPTKFQRFRERLGFLPPDRGPDLLGTRFLVSSKPLQGVPEVGQAGSVKIYANPHALPLAWLTADLRQVGDDEQALTELAAPDFDPAHATVVTLPADAELPRMAPSASGSAEITEYVPSRVRITTRSTGSMLLVTSQAEYPGWSATVDGRPTQLLNVDYAFLGVPVTDGVHTVEFTYRPLSVLIGATISIAALLVSLTAIVLWTRA
jgi:hypothetical protein